MSPVLLFILSVVSGRNNKCQHIDVENLILLKPVLVGMGGVENSMTSHDQIQYNRQYKSAFSFFIILVFCC